MNESAFLLLLIDLMRLPFDTEPLQSVKDKDQAETLNL